MASTDGKRSRVLLLYLCLGGVLLLVSMLMINIVGDDAIDLDTVREADSGTSPLEREITTGQGGGKHGDRYSSDESPSEGELVRGRLVRHEIGLAGCQYEVLDSKGAVLQHGKTLDGGWFILPQLPQEHSMKTEYRLRFQLYENVTLTCAAVHHDLRRQKIEVPDLQEVIVDTAGFKQGDDWEIVVEPIQVFPAEDIEVRRSIELECSGGELRGGVRIDTHRTLGKGNRRVRFGVHRNGGLAIGCNSAGYVVTPEKANCAGGEIISFSPASAIRDLMICVVGNGGQSVVRKGGGVWISDVTEKWALPIRIPLVQGRASFSRSWTAKQGYNPTHEYAVTALLSSGEILRATGIPMHVAKGDEWALELNPGPSPRMIELGSADIVKWIGVTGGNEHRRLIEINVKNALPPRANDFVVRTSPSMVALTSIGDSLSVVVIAKSGRTGTISAGSLKIQWPEAPRETVGIESLLTSVVGEVLTIDMHVRLPGSSVDVLFRRLVNPEAALLRGRGGKPLPKEVAIRKTIGNVYTLILKAGPREKYRLLKRKIL